ncbi:MAG: DUF5693 family protein, partial [Bacillota bacterium]|nr:DUF5693 family protein [Bacillota bacterium]
EESIDSLMKSGKEVDADIIYNIERQYEIFDKLPDTLKNDIKEGAVGQYDLLVRLYNDKIYNFLVNGLEERYEENFYSIYSYEDVNYVVLKGSVKELLLEETTKYLDYLGEPYIENQSYYNSQLIYIGIGYDEEKINDIKESNLGLLLRPINYKPYSKQLIENYIKKVDEFSADTSLMIFHGKSIIGYPEGYRELYEYVDENNTMPVLIETAVQRGHIEQDGIDNLIYDLNYNAVRGFSIWDYIRERYGEYNYTGTEEIENSLFRGITERNIRLIYFKPYMTEKNVFMTDKEEYQESFDRLYERLSDHNIKIGEIQEIDKNTLSITMLFLMFINVIILGMYLLKSNFRISDKSNLIIGFIGIIFSGLLLLYNKSIGGKIFALTSSIVYAGFSIDFMINKIKKIENFNTKSLILNTVKMLVIIFSLGLLGGLITTSFLSQTKYYLEADIFRGVKVSQLMPMLIFMIFYIQKMINEDNKLNIYIEILNKNIKIYYGIIFIILAGVGYYYISRTGHESDIEPLQIEMILRNFLENNLIARPRIKEFLFAAPSLAAAVYFKNKKNDILTFVFALGAVTSITSIINTFTHLRTPLYLSVTRTVFSLGFSIITVLITIMVLVLLEKIYISIKEKIYV